MRIQQCVPAYGFLSNSHRQPNLQTVLATVPERYMHIYRVETGDDIREDEFRLP